MFGRLASLLLCGVLLSCAPGEDATDPAFDPTTLPPSLGARPNILWLSAEDMSPRLGAYGDPLARTPNLDRLAAEGRRYTRVFTVAAVCSPNRAGIITGMFPPSFGAHHMRTLSGAPYAPPPTPYSTVPPPYVKTFTEYLRAAGYYTTNNFKEDYQFETPFTAWDESGTEAHWRNRPDPDQPFFSVFNFMVTHESRIWPVPGETLVTNPDSVVVPPYLPDTPVVRADYARHYDNIARMDVQAGEILRQLEEDGLADNTIVFFWSDHGDGMPRAKRWPYDSGLHVPLIIRAPGYLLPASTDDRLISFVDLAPTALSLAGLDIPAHVQGRAFLGPRTSPAPRYVFASRDRHDEQYDMVRAVRDDRFKYIRNYYPHLPYVLWMAYPNANPTMQEMYRLYERGALEGPQTLFFRSTRPVHELYDTQADPYEIHNLADDPAHAADLERLQQALDDWMARIGDLGPVPETEMAASFWPSGIQPVTEAPAVIPWSRQEPILGPDGLVAEGVSGGSFSAPITVTLVSPTQGASMGYTLDAGEDARWRLFSGPISIDTTTTIRARAVRYGYAPSQITTATFRIE